MTKDDLINIIQNTNAGRFTFVGPNGSGKSYMLGQIYGKIENCIFINEEGFIQSTDKRPVTIFEDNFIYDNNYNRGLSDYKQEIEKMNVSSLDITTSINKKKFLLPTKNKSAGIKKIENIINNLLSRNINNVKYFLFDEPDNYLDDEHIKFIKEIFEVLLRNNKIVCFVTHNPRLLELLNIDIDEIYIFSNWLNNNIVNISTDQLRDLYIDCCDSVSKINFYSNCGKKEQIFYKKEKKLLDTILYNIIHSYDFYKALFYDKVVLAEGLTEKLVFNQSNDFQVYINNFYFCKGKSRYPLLIKIFEKLNKEIFLIFDEDSNDKNKFSFTINSLFDGYKKIIFTPNLEEELIVTEEIIKDILGSNASKSDIDTFRKNFKAEILPFALRNDKNLLKQLENKVAQLNNNEYETFS